MFEQIKAFKSSVIEIGDQSYVQDTYSTFRSNFALYNAVFRIIGDSYFSFDGTRFLSNVAEKSNSIGQLITVSSSSYFNNCTFKQNKAYYTDTS